MSNTNVTDMKAMKFGVEIETVGASRPALAQAIARVIGGRVDQGFDFYKSVFVVAPDGRKWRLMDDASLAVVNGVSGTEIVSPILTYADMDTLQSIARVAREAGAKADSSCGIHVHVDGAGFKANPKAVVHLTRAWARYEELVGLAIDLLPSRKARFCRPVETSFLDRLDAMADVTLDALNRAWYGFLNRNPNHYDATRYHALNLHAIWNKGTVEFRCFNGTLHAGKIKGYVQLCTALAAKALNQKTSRRGKRDFNPTWTKFPIFYFLKGLGLVGDEFATARFHLVGLGKGVAGFKDAATYEAWKVRQGRVAGGAPVASPAPEAIPAA